MADTVLIIDDNPAFRDLLAKNLEQEGFKTRIFNPQDYQCLRDNAPSSGRFEMLLDFSLELEWLEELERDRKLADRLRIWIVTGVPDAGIGTLRARFPNLSIQCRWFDKSDPGLLDDLTAALRQAPPKRAIPTRVAPEA